MAYKQNRRIVRVGSTSKGVVLPKGWLQFYELQQGDTVSILGDSILMISTKEAEEKARKLLQAIEHSSPEVRETDNDE